MRVAIIGDLCHLIVFEIASFNIIMKYRRMQLFRIITIFGPLVFDWDFFQMISYRKLHAKVKVEFITNDCLKSNIVYITILTSAESVASQHAASSSASTRVNSLNFQQTTKQLVYKNNLNERDCCIIQRFEKNVMNATKRCLVSQLYRIKISVSIKQFVCQIQINKASIRFQLES